MTSQIFFDYISKTFYPWLTKNSITPPVILFVDGHISHKSLPLSEFCLEKQIILVSFLPNCTHLMQPMDVVMFRPMKVKWAKVIQDFKNLNQDKDKMTRPDFCNLLKTCLDEILQPNLLKKSFEATAIFPFGADYFDYTKLHTVNVEEERTELEDCFQAPESNPTSEFIETLNQMIMESFPNLLNEFKSCSGDEWNGNIESESLYRLWKKAQTNLHIEVTSSQVPQQSNVIENAIINDAGASGLSNDDDEGLNYDYNIYDW